jgi:hypothetical protein
MIRIRGGTSRWFLAVGVIAVAVAAAGCQSSPDRGSAAARGAPSVVHDAPSPSSSPGDAVGNRPPAPPVGGKSTNAAPVPKVHEPGGRKPTGPPPTLRPPLLPRCHTADLAVEVGQADSGMGRTGLNLALVNRSTHRCRIYGYGGVQLLDAAGAALPSQQVRSGSPSPQLITLRPGGRAYSVLIWVFSREVPPCYDSAFLLVTPPDETAPIRVAFSQTVCGNGRISQGAYQTTPM